MNLRDLEYVTAIDRYRNFGRAADACHVSQPSLSAQVKKLEERLGVELFARTSAGILTTDVGARIVSTAQEVLKQAQRISDTAAEYHDPYGAPLRIGIIPSLAPFVLPFLKETVTSLTDQLQLIFREQPTEALLRELERRAIDIAMLSGPVAPTGFEFTPLFKEQLVLMVSKNHRLANADAIQAEEIPIEEMLLLSEEHCLRDETISLCDDKNVGIDMPDEMFATNFLTMSHYLAGGKGCALVPLLARKIISCANPDVSFVEIDDPAYSREIGFVSRIGCPRQKILHAVCDKIRTQLPPGVIEVS